ncbi:hypothetical protein [Frankia sp. AgKG'84/4]|uniref:hypothetical protein n=1 Tax=Frankia sp. AgKG'84/4 TaxID=573490 RepID=UPI0020105DAB|nr:hypothetical protein [Frankia sp. AgKG'84/4]MCL9792765.1 hypothetical protein [Frankia sp. AgKG'84/4]
MNQLIDGPEHEGTSAPSGVDDNPSASSVDYDGRFLRVAAFVGELGHPFYAEERQRDVWNEASAVGFQFLSWLVMVAAAAMVWIGGASAVPYALAMSVLLILATLVTLEYSKRLGVEAFGAQGKASARRMLLRAAPVFTLQAAFWIGILHAWDALDADHPLRWVIRLAVALTAGIATALWRRRRARRDAHQADQRVED